LNPIGRPLVMGGRRTRQQLLGGDERVGAGLLV
jgi:hypothetical protein